MSAAGGPSIWMVPRRPDPDFVGRAAELAALEGALAASGRSALTQPASVHGLGGVGKTLLAVEYAHRHASDYDAVFWLAAENPTTLAPAFAELARALSLPETGEPDQNVRIAAVLRWLEAHSRWLLVLDNAERREDVEPFLPRRHAGHVLITSRNPDWHPIARAVKVRPLPRTESIELLCKGLESADAAEADRLAEALGDLPLALAQAAAFVRETGVRFADYREGFQTRWAEFDREQPAEPGYGRTVAVTLALALDRLRAGGADASPAETLLARCAFYAPERIPRELLACEFPAEATLNGAIRTLRRFSLIETDAGFVTVHRLVQKAARDRMTPEAQADFAKDAVLNLCERFPIESYNVTTWPECRRLLDHCLYAAVHAIERDAAATPLAEILNRIGIHLGIFN
ncbi:MAG TPA: FxSxx-COOH system tetratricopeptide repeat protein, partial [Isosphaeraceae bacterium]